MKKLIILLLVLTRTFIVFSQSDVAGIPFGHQRLAGRYVGWSPLAPGSVSGDLQIRNDFNQPINFFTNSTQKAQFTVSTGIPAGLFGAAGDGLRIYPNTPGSFPNGYLDLWTSSSAAAANETHIKWDGSGQIGGSGA